MPLKRPVSWFNGASLMVINMEPLIHFIRTVGSTLVFDVAEGSDASAAASSSKSASSIRRREKKFKFLVKIQNYVFSGRINTKFNFKMNFNN